MGKALIVEIKPPPIPRISLIASLMSGLLMNQTEVIIRIKPKSITIDANIV